MSYVIEQKIKGRIYLYQVESYWDKNKKHPRQRRGNLKHNTAMDLINSFKKL
jgi:hypothetical protein